MFTNSSSSSSVTHFSRFTFFTIISLLVLTSSFTLYGFLEYDPIIKKKVPIYPIKPVCSLLVKGTVAAAEVMEAKIVCNVGGNSKNAPSNPSYLSLTLPEPVSPLKNSELFTIIGRTIFILLGKNNLYQTEFKEWPTAPNVISKNPLPPLKKILSIPEAEQIAMIAEKKQLCLGYRKIPSTSSELYVSCFDLPLTEASSANININSIEKKLSTSTTTAPKPIVDYTSGSSTASSNPTTTEFTNALINEKTEMDISQKILMHFKMASTTLGLGMGEAGLTGGHQIMSSSPIQELCAGIGQMAQTESECCPYLALNNNSICAYPPAAFITEYFSEKDHLATLFDYKDPKINLDPQTCKEMSDNNIQEENPEVNYELLMGRSDVLFQNYAYGITSYGQLSSAGLNKELKNFALINTINTRIRTHLFRLRMMRLLQTMQSKFHQNSQEGVASLYSTIFSSMLLSYYFHQQSSFYRMLWGHYRYSPSKLLPLPHRESVNCYYWPFCWRAKETSFGGNLSDMNVINSWNIPKNAPRNRVWPHWLKVTAEAVATTPTPTSAPVPITLTPTSTPIPTPTTTPTSFPGQLAQTNTSASDSIALVDAPISRFDVIGGSPVGFYGRNVNWYDETMNNFDYRIPSPFWMTVYNQESLDSDLDELGEYFFNQLHAAFPPEDKITSNPFIWPHRNLERKEAFLTSFLLDNILNIHGINNLENKYRLQAQCYKNLYQMQINSEGTLKQQVFIQTLDRLIASAYADVGDNMNGTIKFDLKDENSYLIEGETAQTLKEDKTAALNFVWSRLDDLLKGEENSELKNQLKKENLISEEFAFPKFDDVTEKSYRQNIERMLAAQKEEVNSFSKSAVFKTSQERYKKMSQELMVYLKKSLEKQKNIQALQTKGKGNKENNDFLLASLTTTIPDNTSANVNASASATNTSIGPTIPTTTTTGITTPATPVVKSTISPVVTSGLKQMMDRGVYQDVDLKSYSSSDIFSYHSMVYRSFALKILWQGIGQ